MEEDGGFKTRDGLDIYYHSWNIENPRAALIIVHGVGEHSARHNDAAIFFNNKGLSVYAADLRGHGKSQGKRGHINSFKEYLFDLSDFFNIVNKKEAGRNIFLLGQSLGGLIALVFVLSYKEPNLSGVIACAPCLDIILPIPLWKRTLARIISKIYPNLSMKDNSLGSEYLSHDKEVCKSYDNDPLVHRYRTPRFYTELIKTMRYVQRSADKIDIPILILQGGKDMIVSKSATEDFFNNITYKVKEFKLYDSFYHEPMHEIGKEEVLSDIIRWLDLLLPPMTSAAQTA